MNEVGRAFRAWVASQRMGQAKARVVDDEQILFEVGEGQAEVSFWPTESDAEIVELSIRSGRELTPSFFLHFVLEDLGRARELFEEMREVLEGGADTGVSKVLLCCSSGMTTTFFSQRLSALAKELGLGYEFSAASFDCALRDGDEYAAILLAPQVGHLRRVMAAAHPRAAVFEVPGKVFGSYDAPATLRLIMHALREVDVPGDGAGGLRSLRDLSCDRRILVITLFMMRRDTRLGWRLFDRGELVRQGVVLKRRLAYRDVEDLIETLGRKTVDLSTLDAIGITVPGVAYHGSVSLTGVADDGYGLGARIAQRFQVPVTVDNNCNAAAVGCYVSQQEYESIMFYRHEFGHIAGGIGTIIDGRLLKGRRSLAGEPKYFERRFEYAEGYYDACWRAEGLLSIVKNVLVCAIALVSPEAIYVAADTLDDMDVLHDALASALPEDLVPPLYAVRDYVERVYLGEMALCLERLQDPSFRLLGEGV